MKKIFLFTVFLISLAVLLPSCARTEICPFEFFTLEFDQSEIEVDVTPETKRIEVKFHQRDLEDIQKTSIDTEVVRFVILNTTTAKIEQQFNIDSDKLSVPYNKHFMMYVKVNYNLAETTGSIFIDLVPEEITEPVEIHLFSEIEVSDPKYSELTIKLNPAEIEE